MTHKKVAKKVLELNRARLARFKKKNKTPLVMKMGIPKGVGLSAKAEYRRMLFDPCAADLVEPPYLGSESGYLIRTRDVITPTAAGTGLTAGQFDYILQWSPGNLGPSATSTNYGILTGGSTVGAAITLYAGYKGTSTAQADFINATGTPISSFRVAACCVKFIPTGPPLSRQGMVAMCNFPSPLLTSTSTPLFSDIETLCPHPVGNGAEGHEIVWLPGIHDQEYGALEASILDAGYGTLVVGLGGVDSSVNAGGTVATPNGRFEITTIWQWTAKASGGIIQSLNAPPKHTVNDVLSEVVDLGTKIYTGAGKVAHGVAGVAHLLSKVL